MKLRGLLEDRRSVSPVVGVILMVAITVILAAVIGAFVLGVGSSSEESPQVSFEYNYDGAGELTIIHASGDTFTAEQVSFEGSGIGGFSGEEWHDVATTTSLGPSSTVRAGARAQADGLEDDFDIDIVWTAADGDDSSILSSRSGSGDGSGNGVDNGDNGGLSVEGTVSMNPGIENAVVTAYDGTNQVAQTTTDASGTYSIDGVEDGNHLTVSVEGTVNVVGNPLYAGAKQTVSGEGVYDFTFVENAVVTATVDGSTISVIFGAQEGDASTNPVANIKMLQAMNENLGWEYELVGDVDASATSGWNGGDGFDPVGELGDEFTGELDGNGYEIQGLTINRGGAQEVGLFGESIGVVQNVGLVNVDIEGQSGVGGLVGYNGGEVTASYATGEVSGLDANIGGLVGYNNGGEVTASYATVSVEGDERVGGLAGYNIGVIEESYAAGSVTGDDVGGLVSGGVGSTDDSYWDIPASGLTDSAGGTGLGDIGDSPPADEMTGSKAEANMNFDWDNTWVTVDGDYPQLAVFDN